VPRYTRRLRFVTAIVLACCAVLAGAQPRDLEPRDPHAAQLRAAPHDVVTVSAPRRGGVDAHVRPPLFVVPTWAELDLRRPRAWIVASRHAPRAPASTIASTRSSRGPPHS
jgi:hypothetical protein